MRVLGTSRSDSGMLILGIKEIRIDAAEAVLRDTDSAGGVTAICAAESRTACDTGAAVERVAGDTDTAAAAAVCKGTGGRS